MGAVMMTVSAVASTALLLLHHLQTESPVHRRAITDDQRIHAMIDDGHDE